MMRPGVLVSTTTRLRKPLIRTPISEANSPGPGSLQGKGACRLAGLVMNKWQ